MNYFRWNTLILSPEGLAEESCKWDKLEVSGYAYNKFTGKLISSNSHYETKRVLATGTVDLGVPGPTRFEGELVVLNDDCSHKAHYLFFKPPTELSDAGGIWATATSVFVSADDYEGECFVIATLLYDPSQKKYSDNEI